MPGNAVPRHDGRYPEPIRQPVIDLSIDLVNRRLGKTLGRDVIIDYHSLQFGVEDLGDF